MPIYFPRGFNSGEPVRVIGGLTVVRGRLAKQSVDWVVVAAERGLLGKPAGAGEAAAKAVLRAAGAGRELSARPRQPGTVHVLSPGKLPCRTLGLLECSEVPRTAAAITEALGRIGELATARGAREIAIGPFEPGPAAATAVRDVLVERARAGGPRWILVVSTRAEFDAVSAEI